MSHGPTPASRRNKFIVLFLLLGIIPAALFFLRSGRHTYGTLPYLGDKEVNGPGDTTYWTIPPFRFTDQNGTIVSDRTTEGRILVVDFFFTRCATICPKMTGHLQQLQLELSHAEKTETYKDVLILSHTVDPENDSVEVLDAYAKRYHADTARWKFLTGDASTIYRLGNQGYLLNAVLPDSLSDQFLHDEHVVLVDKQRHIRGFYDGTSAAEMGRLTTDLKMLIAEDRKRKREASDR